MTARETTSVVVVNLVDVVPSKFASGPATAECCIELPCGCPWGVQSSRVTVFPTLELSTVTTLKHRLYLLDVVA